MINFSSLKLKLNLRIRPKTMGQALESMEFTAAVYILLSHVKRKSIKHIA